MEKSIKEISISDLLLILFQKLREKNIYTIKGRTKIQKLIFILTREFELPKKFKYFHYTFGPYSSILQREIDELITFDLMQERVLRTARAHRVYEYKLTRKGTSAAKAILDKIEPRTQEILDEMSEQAIQLNKMPLKDLINNAYEHFYEG